MRAKKVIFTLFLMNAFAGCGSSTNTTTHALPSTEDTVGHPVSAADLQGTWASDCVLDKNRNGIYIKEFLTFDSALVRRDTTSYLDPRCSSAFFEQIVLATDQLSADGSYSETRQTILAKPLSTAAAGMFTNAHFCGSQTRWNLNEERTFTDMNACGVELTQMISLRLRNDHGAKKLNAKQCETNDAQDCTTMTYLLSE